MSISVILVRKHMYYSMNMVVYRQLFSDTLPDLYVSTSCPQILTFSVPLKHEKGVETTLIMFVCSFLGLMVSSPVELLKGFHLQENAV